MKKLLLLLLFIAAFFCSQAQLDSLVKDQGKKIDGLTQTVKVIKQDVDSAKAYITTQKENTTKADKDCDSCEIGFTQWALIFSPIWMFVIALFVIRKKLKGFSLKEALTESELPKKTIPNPEYTAANVNMLAAHDLAIGVMSTVIPPTIEVTASDEYPKSSSRYIAFITSSLTWIIILCLACFFIYQYMKTGRAPELGGLSSVMLALGIGVVPYAFNKISEVAK